MTTTTNSIIIDKNEFFDVQLRQFLDQYYAEVHEDGSYTDCIDFLSAICDHLTTQQPMRRSDRAPIIETVINFFETVTQN